MVGIAPGGVYGLVKKKWGTKDLFGHGVCDLLVLDEASQMNLPKLAPRPRVAVRISYA